MEKLKIVVIREEFVALTGDFKKAITLNQMIYWSERSNEVDEYIKEESERIKMFGQGMDVPTNNLTHGWVYKSAEQLSKETMMNVNRTTMSKYLRELVEKGWLDRRKNPKFPLDKTFQYRPNLLKINKDLIDIGYSLQGYRFKPEFQLVMQQALAEMCHREGKIPHRRGKKPHDEVKNPSMCENTTSCGAETPRPDRDTGAENSPETTNRDFSSEITSKQQHEREILDAENQVVVVRDFVKEKFLVDLTDSEINSILKATKKHNRDLLWMLNNAYKNRPKRIDNVVAMIVDVINKGGYNTPVKPPVQQEQKGYVAPVPEAVQRQLEEKERRKNGEYSTSTDEKKTEEEKAQLEENQKRIQDKLKAMREKRGVS